MLIKEQLRLSFIAALVFLLVGGATLLFIYQRARHAEELRSWAMAVMKEVFDCNVFGSEFATLESDRAREQFESSSAHLSTLLQAPPPGEILGDKALEDLRARKRRMDNLVARLKSAQAARETTRRDIELETELKNMLAGQIQLHSQAILNAATKLRRQASRQSAQLWNITVIFSAIMIAMLVAGAAGILAFYYRRILLPLERLTDAAQRLGAGELGTRVPVPYSDELGTVGRSFNAMAEQLKERETELKQRIKDMDTLCYSIAHDLKAPLRAVSGISNLLQEDYGQALGAEAEGLIRRMQLGAQRMDALIDGLLQYGALTHRDFQLAPVDLEVLWREVLQDGVETEAHRRKAVLRKEGVLPTVRGNGFVLRTVMQNLVTNALKYGPSTGEPVVVISAEIAQEKVRLSVRDNGIGIAPEHQDKIFGLFERLHTREQYEGTGLGLAMARRGIERLGGKLSVSSQPGKGSTFTVELPYTSTSGADTNIGPASQPDREVLQSAQNGARLQPEQISSS